MEILQSAYLLTGDYITVGISSGSAAGNVFITITATPEVNDVVVVESTDSVISEWTEYTPVEYNAGTATWSTLTGWWRRDGQDMLIRISAIASGAGSGSGVVGFSIPSGYVTDPDDKLTAEYLKIMGVPTARINELSKETLDPHYYRGLFVIKDIIDI